MKKDDNYDILSNRDARFKYQIITWSAGISTHNHIDNICCPDFSCCRPNLLASRQAISAYIKALNNKDQETINQLCSMFYAAMAMQDGLNVILTDAPTDAKAYH